MMTWFSDLVDKEPLENIGARHLPIHTILIDLKEEFKKKKKEFNKSSTVIFNYLSVHFLGYDVY